MAFLRARQVSLRLGGKLVVDGVSADFLPGQVTAVLGPNGAGKSSLLRLLSGEVAPDGGEVLLEGRSVQEWSVRDLALRRALMRQSVEVSFPLTVFDVMQMGIVDTAGYWGGAGDRALAQEFLELVGMAHFLERDVRTLSGGERQRVLLARALLQVRDVTPDRPRALLLDEPTASLDLEHQHETMELARQWARRGAAVVVVLHDANLALRYADRAVVLSSGRVDCCGAVGEALDVETMRRVFRVECRLVRQEGSPAPMLEVLGPVKR